MTTCEPDAGDPLPDRNLNHLAVESPPLGALKQPALLLRVEGLSKWYGKFEVLRQITFGMNGGETLAILGESGCGKTTLLRIIAGLLCETSGEIHLDGQSLRGIPARHRGIVYLDQEPLLFEHLSVRENIAFAMRLRSRPDGEVRTAVDEMLGAIGLLDHADKRDWQLSGGQKQRVAFARAVLASPRILLLDEPFSSLDGATRSAMRALFGTLRQRYSLTSVLVTHDVKEALIVGDRFALMADGRLRIYPDRAAFLRDEATGIPRESRFWSDVASESMPGDGPMNSSPRGETP